MFPEWLKPILFVAGYVALMRWILPALGVRTCMSGSCGIAETPSKPGGASARASESSGKNPESSGNHA